MSDAASLGVLMQKAISRGHSDVVNSVALRASREEILATVLNWIDSQGTSQLMTAVRCGHKNCVEMLLILGASVTYRTPVQGGQGGETALHMALTGRRRDDDIVRLLLEAGSKILVQNAKGVTPWEIVHAEGQRHHGLCSLFCWFIRNDAVFTEHVFVKGFKLDGRGVDLGMRCVHVLHRTGGDIGNEYLRSVIVIMQDHQHQRGRYEYWLNGVDLNAPEVKTTDSSWELMFVCTPMARSETKLIKVAFHFPLTEAMKAVMVSFLEALHHVPSNYAALADGPIRLNTQAPNPELRRDMQVAIRHLEVMFNGDPAEQGESSVKPAVEEKTKNCIICLESPVCTGFVHGHSVHCCACMACAKLFQKNASKCPICRETILTVLTEFYT